MQMSRREEGRTWWETENERIEEEYKNTTKEGKFENEEERVRGINERKREKIKKKRNEDRHSEHIYIKSSLKLEENEKKITAKKQKKRKEKEEKMENLIQLILIQLYLH
jgi:hypothetical protein